jgi:hypothetical protein
MTTRSGVASGIAFTIAICLTASAGETDARSPVRLVRLPAADTASSVRWKLLSLKLLREAGIRATRAASRGDSTELKGLFRGAAGLNARMAGLLNVAMSHSADSAEVDAARPSSRAAVAAAAAAMIVHFIPGAAPEAARAVEQDVAAETRAGVTRPRVDAGLRLGRAIADRTLAWGKGDGTDAPAWRGTIPTGAGMWWGRPGVTPGLIDRLQYRTWVLRSADQFRPKPPPAFGSAEFADALGEVRRVARERTAAETRIAQQWGLRSAIEIWEEIGSGAMIRHGVADPRAAHILALLTAAGVDAGIACSDAKYKYWLLRPTQADSTISLADSLTLPNFPAYPSGHACISGAMSEVIGHFMPAERAEMARLAEEAAISRLYAGVHFRFDNDVGLALGREVARYVIAEDSAGRVVGRWR